MGRGCLWAKSPGTQGGTEGDGGSGLVAKWGALKVWGEGHLQARACLVSSGWGGWVTIRSCPGLWSGEGWHPRGCEGNRDHLLTARTSLPSQRG